MNAKDLHGGMEGGFCLTSALPLTPWATLSTREGKPPVLMYPQGYTFWIILALVAAVFLAGQGTSFLDSLQVFFGDAVQHVGS